MIFTGPQPKAGTVIKWRRSLSFFQRYIVRDILLTAIYRRPVISYPPFWKARGMEETMEDSQEKSYSFLGNNTFPNLYDALVYERKFK